MVVRPVMSSARSRSRRRSRKRQDGAVMLVVMLILLVATAMAGISLQSTQHELRASGYNRLATQTQYVAESAMATTFSWLDQITMSPTAFDRQVGRWSAAAPPMDIFGEPAIDPNNAHFANRTEWLQQSEMQVPGTGVLSPLTRAGSTIGPVDALGTLGPRSVHVPGNGQEGGSEQNNYMVDLYDCKPLQGMGSPGTQINQASSSTVQERQYYCVVTARGRVYVPDAPTKEWENAPVATYTPNTFTAAHDARGTLIIPVP